MVEIKQQLVPVANRKATYGTGNPKKKMVVHQTGNAAKGANAKMHANLQDRGYSASWHIQSDDKEIIQSWPFTYRLWHASTGSRADGGNMIGIGWEICINADGNYLKSLELASKGIAKVMKQEGIPMSGLTTHNAEDRINRKWCPAQILSGKNGINWDKFRKMVQNELNLLNGKPAVEGAQVSKPAAPASGIVKTYAEHAVFTPNDTIIVRDAPSTTGNEIARYKAGESVIYHTVHMGNGYVWLQYNRAGGGQGYIPCRTYQNGHVGELWGKISDTAPASKPLTTYVQLSKNVSSWRIYPLGVAPVAGKEKGFLNPAKFGGLVYEVEGYEDNGKTAIIRTGDFGRGKIYLDSDANVFKQ